VLELGETFSSGTFKIKDSAGAPGIATVTVVVTLPDGTTAVPTVTTPALGDYVFDYTTTVVGRLPYVVTATGGVLGALVRKFADVIVVGAATSTGVVSLEEVKRHLNIPLTNTGSDTELEMKIAAATEKIELRCGPVVPRTVVNERHDGGGRAVWLVEAPGAGGTPFITVTAVTSLSSLFPISVGDLDVDPSGRITYFPGLSLRFPSGEYLWSYTTGRTVVPAGLREAALNFVKGSWETQRGMTGLPWKGAVDTPTELPGMGLVLWRLEQDLQPFLRPPGMS
jgi:hypothetical protein